VSLPSLTTFLRLHVAASSSVSHLRLAAVVVVVTVLVGLLGACGDDASDQMDAEVVQPGLVQTPSGERLFRGTLVNQARSTIAIAEVEVALYDDEGSRIETMRIQVQDVSPRDSAEFSQTIDSDRPIQQAQVQEILIP
jgi:hypothetical protein